MGKKSAARIVLVTCGSRVEARAIAKAVVTRRLAACVSILSAPVESVYRWKGRVESAKEFLLLIKTTTRRVKELQRAALELHSYDLPEFVVIEIANGSAAYLKWIAENA
jgi:periplasmic divalent cation tolerance protein